MNENRSLKLNSTKNEKGTSIVYIMSRDQRVKDNFALLEAFKSAKEKNLDLYILFNLYPRVKNRIFQHYKFMIDGLKELAANLYTKEINFILTFGNALDNYRKVENKFNPAITYFDFSPLKGPIKVKEKFAEFAKSECIVVDTHNIIPVWQTSDKEEFAAYTIRPKILELLKNYLIEPEQISKLINKELKVKNTDKDLILNPDEKDFDEFLNKVKAEKIVNYHPEFESGEKKAGETLSHFLKEKLENYNEKRNIPGEDGQSNLSPYLHFGQISSLRISLEVNKFIKERSKKFEDSSKAFLEELIIRKELSDNYCYYNKSYDSFNGLKPWAKTSLIKHLNDKREFIYSLNELETANTYDYAWNAAQKELIIKGKIHGYMRMYWAKKILEWTLHPREAIERAIYLNDKYHLDGYDPNGYVGILWSIGGIHDRPWFEREIFGQIRYMNYKGLERKFNLKNYIESFIENY